MIDDVNRTFDLLDQQRILAQLVGFILTPEGRAVAMDFTAVHFVKTTADARIYNDLARRAYVEALEVALRSVR